ncbi:hypothetical protein KAK07_11895 [Ideonella sp. 4Y16]|uniref:hypothetical protein n=1 Tax=Ideonella alba TaxID=2824118 RepID=UPI001B36F076|nr:hypothetical protein [Ideonella alba]MBQ0944037.1 hypothetical protein [Ideonella alba]
MTYPSNGPARHRARPILAGWLAALLLASNVPTAALAARGPLARPPATQPAKPAPRPATPPPRAPQPAQQAKARAPVINQVDTSRHARREAMRQAGIPTSQQPVKQLHTPAGRQLHYELPKPGGAKKPMVVTHQTTDRVPGHGPHWEAGRAKQLQRTDPLGRTPVTNDKAKVNHAR